MFVSSSLNHEGHEQRKASWVGASRGGRACHLTRPYVVAVSPGAEIHDFEENHLECRSFVFFVFFVVRSSAPVWLVRACLAAFAAAVFSVTADAVEYDQLAKYWTADAQKVPYRALQTPGREHGEMLPLIVFLHGDWQDGTDNESQLVGYGNGSLELVERAIEGSVPLVYMAPQTTGAIGRRAVLLRPSPMP